MADVSEWYSFAGAVSRGAQRGRRRDQADSPFVDQLTAHLTAATGKEMSISGAVTANLYAEDMGGYAETSGPGVPDGEASGTDEDEPISGPLWQVWRSGHRVRIEDAAGHLRYLCDGTTTWFFDEDVGSWAAQEGTQSIFWMPPGTSLLYPRDPTRLEIDDYNRPTGPPVPDHFLDRPVWRVDLAAPSKPHLLRLLIDRETAVILRSESVGTDTYETWTTFSAQAHHPDEIYGPPES